MKILKTKLKDVYEIVPEPNQDERGFFKDYFVQEFLKNINLKTK